MLKRSIGLVVVGIFVVFGAIGVLVLTKSTLNAAELGGDGKITVYFQSEGYDMKGRDIRTFINERTGRLETRANDTAIPTPKSFGFEKDGYTFKGWRKADDIIVYGDYMPAGLSEEDGILVFVAEWSANTYRLSFQSSHPTKGMIEPSAIDVTMGETMPLLGNRSTTVFTFIRNYSIDGYTFKGWRTEPKGEGIALEPENAYTLARHAIAYGYWVKQTGEGENPTTLVATLTSKLLGTAGPLEGPLKARTYDYRPGARFTFHYAEFLFDGYVFTRIDFDANTTINPTMFVNGQYTVTGVSKNLNMVAYYYKLTEGGNTDGGTPNGGTPNGGVDGGTNPIPTPTYTGTTIINGTTSTFTFKSGSTFTFHADRFDIYEGKRFTGVTITANGNSATVGIAQFIDGKYTTGAYTSNVTFTANYVAATVTLTVQYVKVGGGKIMTDDVYSGKDARPYNEELIFGLKDWKDASGEVFTGFDKVTGYTFSHFQVVGEPTLYTKDKLLAKGTNYFFIYQIKANTTVVVYYK